MVPKWTSKYVAHRAFIGDQRFDQQGDNIELRKKKKQQPRTTISVPIIYVGMTSKIKLKVLLSTPMLELKYEY